MRAYSEDTEYYYGPVKDGRITIRCLPEEVLAMKAIARAERRNLSEALRELIRAEAQRRGLWLKQGATDATEKP